MGRVLVVSIVVVVAILLACGCQSQRPAGGDKPAVAAAATVKDPVCGMDVDPAQALKVEHEGKTYYFCSKDCQEKFQKNPAQYTGQKPK